MSSLVTNLNSSIVQEIVKWATTTADGCVHTADTTQLDFAVGKLLQTHRDCHQLVAHSVHIADATQLDELSRVGDVYRASATGTFRKLNDRRLSDDRTALVAGGGGVG